MTPQRIQLRRTKGWRKPEGAVVVARPTKWGNPCRPTSDRGVGRVDGQDMFMPLDSRWDALNDALRRREPNLAAVIAYRAWLDIGQLPFRYEDVRRELAGKDLACWCPLDQPCHADVLLELANQ